MNDFKFPVDPPAGHLGLRLRIGIENHHTIPKEWARLLYENANGLGAVPPNGWDAWLNDMPGIWLHRMDHQGENGTASFHALLRHQMSGTSSPVNLEDNNDILSRIGQSYQQWDPDLGPEVWAVARKWLEASGIQ